jgi:hypothetical protein
MSNTHHQMVILIVQIAKGVLLNVREHWYVVKATEVNMPKGR